MDTKVKTEYEASCEEDMDDEETEDEEDDQDDASIGEPSLQQTSAYIRTYSKYGYRFMQLTHEAYLLKDDLEIAEMLAQQRLTGLAKSLFYKIDEERCAQFMKTFDYLTKSGRVKGPDGEERVVTISADLISRSLNIPNWGREAQLKNTNKYFKHVLAPNGKTTCDGVRFEDIVDPRVQKKARFLQMITVCTYRNRQSRILKTNLARICAPAELHNWAVLIASDLCAGCRNLSNRNCVCGSVLTRVIYTELGLASEPCFEVKQVKTNHETTSHAQKRKINVLRDENNDKASRIMKEKKGGDVENKMDVLVEENGMAEEMRGVMENGFQKQTSKDFLFLKEKMTLMCPNLEPHHHALSAEEPSASSPLSDKEEQANTQATNSSSTLSIRSGSAILKEKANTGDSQRMKSAQSLYEQRAEQEECMRMGCITPPLACTIPKECSSPIKAKQQEFMAFLSVEEEDTGGKKPAQEKLPRSTEMGKLLKLKSEGDVGSEMDLTAEGKRSAPAFVPSLQLLPEAVQEGTGSSQEKRNFRGSFPWYPREHFVGGAANLWSGVEMALWDQAFALMDRLRLAVVSDKQRLEEIEHQAQSSIQRSSNLEQAYHALELQMKIQQTQFEALEIRHSKLLKEHTSLKENMKELSLQIQSVQLERDKAAKLLKFQEAQLRAFEDELQRVGVKRGCMLVHDVVTGKNALDCEDDEDRGAKLESQLDAALVELEARKLQLKEARGENAKLREQKALLEAALQEKRHDLDSFMKQAEAVLPDLEKLTRKYHSYKRNGQDDDL